ncbi:MAG: PD-(D/E)XK nuclease family protein [Actinobacteria bacterium]|nr:PD-(D/E)XK nuclease family protein [Actinomycetota bacterium]
MIVFPEIEPGDAVRLSGSTFVAYGECADYAKSRIEGVWGPESVPAFKGGLAHRVFARHLGSGPISADRLEQVCREEIGGSNLNFKMAALSMKPSGLERVIDEVGALYERFRRFPVEGFQGAEVQIQVEPVDGVTLVGSVDAVFSDDGGVRLVDWKTGELGEVHEQLRFYALLWVLDKGEIPSKVEAVSIRTGERFTEEPGTDSLRETARQVAGIVNALRRAWAERRDIERRGGPWCRYCGLLEECVEGRAATALL